MDLVLASRNKKKIAEFQDIFALTLPGVRLLSLDDVGFEGDIVEDGSTFEENSLIKASRVLEKCGIAAVSDDSGLCVDALDGRPGIYSARYAGEGGDADACIDKLLRGLADVPDEGRAAQFVCVITCCLPDGGTVQVRGECPGTITRRRMGDNQFGYDPVFYYPPLGATFAQLDAAIKNSVSHRAKAMELFSAALRDIITRYYKQTGNIEMITTKQRAYLRGMANTLDAIFQIGKDGFSHNMIKQFEDALAAREIIKVTVLETCEHSAREAAQMAAEQTQAEIVQVIGRRFVLYKPSKEKLIELPK